MTIFRSCAILIVSALLLIAPLSNARTGPKLIPEQETVDAAKKLYDGIKQDMDLTKMLDEYNNLSNTDKRLEPDYSPPGTPSVPSKCYENKACRPCYVDAYDKVNTTRKNLEKVRAHYNFTHRFTAKGIAFMQGVAAAAGGIAAMGAAAEADKVDESLKNFDQVVRNKNLELLEKLQSNLKEVAKCEAKFYKTEDWYDRYGYMYYQFMYAHYDYVVQ